MIKLNVTHTVINASNLSALVEGNINSIYVHFVFSSEWTDLVRTAVFSCGNTSVAVPLSSDKCAIPWEVLAVPDRLFLALRGADTGNNTVLCTKNVFLGTVSPSLAAEIAAEAHDPTPNIIDVLCADVAVLKAGGAGTDGKSAYEIAAENGFIGTEVEWLASLKGAEGSDGIDGVNGSDGEDGYTPVKGTDYFTASDIADIVNEVISSLPVYNGGVE